MGLSAQIPPTFFLMGADVALAAGAIHCRFSFQQTSYCIAEVGRLKAANVGTKLALRFDILFAIGTLLPAETATGLGPGHLTHSGENSYQCAHNRGARSMFLSALGGSNASDDGGSTPWRERTRMTVDATIAQRT